MPDATAYRDETPDVTANNQDAPADMNQPPAHRGMNIIGAETGTIVQTQEPAMGGSPIYEVLPDVLESEAGQYHPGTAPDDLAGFHSQYPGDAPVPQFEPVGQPGRSGSQPFETSNQEATPVFQRASTDWNSGMVALQVNFPVQIVGRQKGRQSTTLWVPTKDASGTATLGCVIGSSEAEVTTGGGANPVPLNVGDSVTITSEGPVWAAVLIGNTTGNVCFQTNYNPPGGELGGL